MNTLSKSQPTASLLEFADLLMQAEALLGKLADAQDIPFYNQRLKLRTHIQQALGIKPDDAQADGE